MCVCVFVNACVREKDFFIHHRLVPRTEKRLTTDMQAVTFYNLAKEVTNLSIYKLDMNLLF